MPVVLHARVLIGSAVATLLLALLVGLAPAASASVPPANDDLADAVAVTALPSAHATHIGGATTEEGEQLSICLEMASTVWYALTLPSSGPVEIDTAGSDFDSAVVVLTGSGHDDLFPVACANDVGEVQQAKVAFMAEAGVRYLVQVGASEQLPPGQGALRIAFREAPRATGKPTIINSRLADQAALARWAEEIPGGQRLVKLTATTSTSHRRPGAPETHRDVEVLVRESTVVDGVRHNDEWFGFVTPAPGAFRFDPALKTASVLAEVELEHTRIIVRREDDPDPEVVDLPPATGVVELTFTGVGPTLRDTFTLQERGLDERWHAVQSEHYRFAELQGTVTVDGRAVVDGPPWQALLLRAASFDTLWYRSS